MDFHEIWHLRIFRRTAEIILSFIKSDKINGYFICRPVYISDYICGIGRLSGDVDLAANLSKELAAPKYSTRSILHIEAAASLKCQ
jgi:hypothetical protein